MKYVNTRYQHRANAQKKVNIDSITQVQDLRVPRKDRYLRINKRLSNDDIDTIDIHKT